VEVERGREPPKEMVLAEARPTMRVESAIFLILRLSIFFFYSFIKKIEED
jgi:hypothetical protein